MSLCVTLANWVSGIMPAKTRRLRPDAWQAGMSKASLARYESNAARIASQMSEIFKDREKSSWKNNSIYYNIMELLKDVLGPVGNALGTVYLGGKLGAAKKATKAAHGWSLSTPNPYSY